MPIIQVDNKDNASKKKAQTNTVLVNLGGVSKAVEHYSESESGDNDSDA
jgi:hypothetical protein